MDTQQLQAFIAVAETGSFSTAAEQLHLTQPAISKRISGLEQLLETRLFDRIGFDRVTSHTFRKTGATGLDEAGISARQIAD
jgi:DNA-binding transcriptional LysR family regulator